MHSACTKLPVHWVSSMQCLDKLNFPSRDDMWVFFRLSNNTRYMAILDVDGRSLLAELTEPKLKYTVFRKKVVYLIFGHKVCKCRQVFKTLSLINSQGYSLYICYRHFYLTWCFYTTLWNFNIQNNCNYYFYQKYFLFYTKLSKY